MYECATCGETITGIDRELEPFETLPKEDSKLVFIGRDGRFLGVADGETICCAACLKRSA